MSKKEFNNKVLKDTKEAVTPTNDFVFKRIFGKAGNESLTKNLIESITNDKIEEINLDGNRILDKDILTDKVGILDVRAILNGNIEVDIEMQVASKDDIEERLLFYWARLHTKTVVKGEEYKKLRRTVAILIADFELKKLKDIPKYHTKWKIVETEFYKKVLTEKFEIDIIELPKVKKYPDYKNKELLIWVKFFTNPERLEEHEMENNEAVKKAKEELEEIKQNEHDAWLAELRIIHEMDKKAELSYAKNEGIEEGLKEGIEQGVKQGAKAKQIEIAKKMLKRGDNIEDIVEVTDLTKEEIEELK